MRTGRSVEAGIDRGNTGAFPTLAREAGSTAHGHLQAPGRIISRDGNRIDWSDGTYWMRDVVYTQWRERCLAGTADVRWPDEHIEMVCAPRRVPQAA